MSAIRKLAAEASDNGLLAPELAAGISRVKSAKTQGIRTGNWLSQRQAQAPLNAPDIGTLRGLRDRAILPVLLGCGLRRSEVAALTPHRANADMGESSDRRVDASGGCGGRLRFPIR
jgi:site-specific recombinase XerD